MKGIFKLFPVALAVASLASCSDFDEQYGKKAAGEIDGSKIVATISEPAAMTRVAMARNDEGKRGLVFVESDAINVYNLDASTKFYGYTLTSGANSDKAEFEFNATASSSGITEAPDLASGEFYAVTKSLGAKIYSLSPGTNGPELSIQIPATFKKEDVDATWGDNLEGKGYTMPLPLWGKLNADGNLMSVNFQYLTGFLGINLTTLRAGTKYIKITSGADEPISGYFQATLDPATPANSVLTAHEALTSSNEIIIEIDPADYEGDADFFYVPLIAQTYSSLKIEAYKATPGDIADGTLFELASGKSFTVAPGKGISLTTGMTVMTDATSGADLSSKIYELTKRLPGKPFTIGLLNDLSSNETVYIDKNATSTINITMADGKAITGNITFVEGTCTNWDQESMTATWSTEATNILSESATKKHTLNVVYDNTVVNSGNLNFYLPNAAASIDAVGAGAKMYGGKVTSLTATDGGFTIGENAQLYKSAAMAYTNEKDGPIVVEGFTGYIIQNGNGDVTVNNLNRTMEKINMGASGKTVSGKLTINGAAHETAANNAMVRLIYSYSTGKFTANNIDKTSATSEGWAFNETAEGGINITNNGNYISSLTKLSITKKNDLNLTNTIVATYDYTGKKKANVTAAGKSAIKTLTGDADDMLTITSTWDGSSSDVATNVYNGTTGAVAIDNVIESEIHTAFQLASLKNITAALSAGKMKSTTTIDLECENADWTPIVTSAAVTINGDGNDEDESATIKNVNVTPTTAGGNGGLFGAMTQALTLSNLNVEGVEIGNVSYAGAIVAQSTANVTLKNVIVSDASIEAVAVSGSASVAGGMIGYTTGDVTANVVSISGDEVKAATNATGSYAGGLVGWQTSGATTGIDASDVDITFDAVEADNAGGLVANAASAVSLDVTATTSNDIAITKVSSLLANGAAGGLIGNSGDDVIVKATNVTAAVEGLLNLGGMIGSQTAGNVKFGDATKANATNIDVTFALAAGLNTAANQTTYADKFGSVNTYIGNATAGTIEITKWCTHGAAIQTVAAKEALNFKKNVVTTTDGINTNYWYFFSGNPWVGTVGASVTQVKFPNNDNVEGVRTSGTDFNVRRMSPQYLAESFSDWDE